MFSYPPFQFVNSFSVSISIDWSTADLSIEFQLAKSLCLSITKLFQRAPTLTYFDIFNFHGPDIRLFVCVVHISFIDSSLYPNLPCCDKRCDFKSKPIQLPPSSNSWPTSWIGDEAAMAVPCFGKHPSIPAYYTNFIFQFPMVQLITSLHLAYMYFSILTFAAPWNFIRFPSLPLLEPSLHQRSSELPFFDIENYKQPL